jgi:hypothetical protein
MILLAPTQLSELRPPFTNFTWMAMLSSCHAYPTICQVQRLGFYRIMGRILGLLCLIMKGRLIAWVHGAKIIFDIGRLQLPVAPMWLLMKLSSAEEELLLWHWKMGIGMQRVQELMRCVQVEEPDGSITVMDRVITPRIKSAATCLIQVCQSCQLSCARL